MAGILMGMKYSFYIIFHPFDGFYDMRHEKKGNPVSASILYVLFIIVTILSRQLSGFLVLDYNPETFNIYREIMNIAMPILLWCVSNWCITALTDGEGRFVDIYMATAFSLVPVTMMTALYVIASNVVVENELDFLGIIMFFGMIWSGFLLFSGILTIHQFTVLRTAVTILITVFGMLFIIFLAMLFGSIVDEMIGYLAGIVTEIRLRM